MEWFVEKFVSLIVYATAYIADTFGNSILGLLTMDVGSGKSFFDLVFSSIGNFYQYFVIIAIAFLLINYVWQLSKMMFLSQGANDTPLGLTAWTMIAGCLIYAGQPIIYFFEGFFNTIYSALLDANLSEGSDVAIDFLGVSEKMTSAMSDGTTETASGAASTAGSIGALLLTLLLLVMLTYQFIMFLIEMAERYIVLGVLYYTCPFAFSMLGSRSTGNIFSSWVRMVGSQLFLMLCNVIFFRLFMMGLGSYDGLIETYNQQVEAKAGIMASYNKGTVVIVWVLMMHGILAIATRVDSYLNTLGLSAAQTGRGLAGALVAAGMGVRRTVSSIKSGAGKAYKVGSGAAHLAGAGVGKAKNRIQKMSVHTDENGHPTTGTFGNAMDRKLTKKQLGKLNGAKVAEGFLKNTDLNGTSLANNIDKSSFKANEDGSFSMTYRDPKTGERAEITMSSMDADMKGHTSIDPSKTQGRVVTMTGADGKQMKMFAAATGAAADAFNTANPAIEKKMAEFNKKENCSAQEVAPGVWQTTRTDGNGNVIEAKEYASAQLYNPDASLNSSTEQIGDMSYHVSDITGATNAPALSDAANPAFDFKEIKEMGDITSSVDYSLRGSQGLFDVTVNGQEYTAGASALWNVSQNATNVQTIHASNGAEYKMMPKNQAETFMPKGRNVSIGADGRAHGAFATPKNMASSAQIRPVVAPKMYQAAQKHIGDAYQSRKLHHNIAKSNREKTKQSTKK